MNLEEFRKEFINQLRADAAINSTDTEEAFIERSLEILKNCGEISDIKPYYFGKRRNNRSQMQFNAYGYDEADGSLVLFISDFKDQINPPNLNRTQLELLYKRMVNFLDEVYFGHLNNYCDDSDEVLNIARDIRKNTGKNIITSNIIKYKFYIITNAKLSSTVKSIKQDSFNDRPTELNVWTIERYFEVINSKNSEPIFIEMSDYGVSGIPSLKEDVGDVLDYDAYLAIVPGKFLADVYLKYGSRLLERNVRAFLSIRGKVNSGIRNSIIKEPTKFFTYNNGIAATASNISIDDNGRITSIQNLQIINGGQTTASLASAVIRKENENLDGIYVAMKLTVIKKKDELEESEEIYNNLVEKISRCANCQNPVKDADFFSNSPFHVLMGKLSEKCIAPPVNGSPYSTIWYYERSRGKYDQEQFKMTKSEADKFKKRYPKNQKITKEDLAKYMTTMDCHPEKVVYGGAKIMKHFAETIEKDYAEKRELFNEFYFKKVVCSAIIYRSVDNIVNKQPWYPKGGNKAQIVPYTISKIISAIPNGLSIDFDRIWKKQSLYPSFVRQIEILSKRTHEFLLDSHGIIVRDFARDPKTWKKFSEEKFVLEKDFLSDLITLELVKEEENGAKKEQKEKNNIAAEIEVYNFGSAYWRNLIVEAKSKGLLNPKEESILKTATYFDGPSPVIPTTAQAKKILQIRDKLGQEGLII